MPTRDPSPEFAHLSDVPFEVEVELDRYEVTIREVLNLEKGSILPLNKAAGEAVDIVVGGVSIGTGEMIALSENAGVRISELQMES